MELNRKRMGKLKIPEICKTIEYNSENPNITPGFVRTMVTEVIEYIDE